MQIWQQAVLFVFAFFQLIIAIKGFAECKNKKNAFGLTPWLFPFGIFVWGDALIFGFFWFLAGLVSFLLGDWILFLLIIAVFWLVRSLGETIYWFNQQFSTINRQPPEKLPGYRIVQNDSIWFINQIFVQCITIISFILTLYLAKIWLRQF